MMRGQLLLPASLLLPQLTAESGLRRRRDAAACPRAPNSAAAAAAELSGERQRTSVACQVHICPRSPSRTHFRRDRRRRSTRRRSIWSEHSSERGSRRGGGRGLSVGQSETRRDAGCCAERGCFQTVGGGKRACNVRVAAVSTCCWRSYTIVNVLSSPMLIYTQSSCRPGRMLSHDHQSPAAVG